MVSTSPRIAIPSEAVRAGRQHLTAHFGRPVLATAYRASSRAEVPDLEVGVFGQEPAPVIVASAGASARPAEDGAPREFAMFTRSRLGAGALRAASELVARVAADGPALGRVVRASDELSRVCAMRALVVYPAWPLPDAVRTFRRRDGTSVTLAWLVPVHADEADLARRDSATALWRRFASNNVDLLDLGRSSIEVS